MKTNQKVTITKNGPYLVSGNIPLSKTISIVRSQGEPEKWQQGKQYPKQEQYALCSCGKSQNKPYCDGTHIKIGFNGTEEASKKQYKDQNVDGYYDSTLLINYNVRYNLFIFAVVFTGVIAIAIPFITR